MIKVKWFKSNDNRLNKLYKNLPKLIKKKKRKSK